MKNISIILCLSFIFFCACNQKSKKLKLNIPLTEIRLSTYKEKVFKNLPEQLVVNKRYIHLEMKNGDNYIGLIDKVLFRNNKFYVLDVRTKSLVVFDINGKYMGNVGKVNQDYLNIADFDVDKSGKIYIVDGKADNFLIFSDKYFLIRSIKSPFEVDIAQHLNDGNFLFGLSSWNKNDNATDKIIKVDKNLKVLKRTLSYTEFIDDNFWVSRYRFLETNTAIFYNRPLDNDVFVFDLSGQLKKSYRFNFGAMNVPDNDKTEIDSKINNFNKYRMLTHFTFVNDKYGFGKIWDKRKFKFFYLDIQSKVFFIEDIATPNDLTNIVDFDGKHLISYISAAQFDEKELSKLPVETQKHLDSGGFVICDTELK